MLYNNNITEDLERVIIEENYENFKNFVENIKINGVKQPIVVGPQSMEGYHGLIAAKMAGLNKIPA